MGLSLPSDHMTTATAKPATVAKDEDEKDDDDPLIFYVTSEQRQALMDSKPEDFVSRFDDFIKKIKDTFETEGVVVIRGLLDDDLLERLNEDSQTILDSIASKSNTTKKSGFSSLKFGPVFSNYTSFRETALTSTIPRFVAIVLLGMNSKNDGPSLHVLKDVFLAKGREKKCCGWHVDDVGFWPISARSMPGVNAWIAIDDIPSNHGGGLGVSPGSHRASWRHDAYEIIGSTQLYPEEGMIPGTPFCVKMTKSEIPGAFGRTCDMEYHSPVLASTIDRTRKVFDFKRGDILFHTRWIFHRSMPLTSDGEEYFLRLGRVDPTIRRYSIRYEYGDSQLLRGINSEFSVMLNPKNLGEKLDQVNRSDGPFYPKCWPEVEDFVEMDKLVIEKFPLAEVKSKEYFQKLIMQANIPVK